MHGNKLKTMDENELSDLMLYTCFQKANPLSDERKVEILV
jgi:hypothetical protein